MYNHINKKYMFLFFGILILVMIGAYILNTVLPSPYSKPSPYGNNEELKSSYVTIRDTKGNIILQTGLPVHKDDEYINEKNIHYKIIKVTGNNATAEIKKGSQSNIIPTTPNSASLAALSRSIPVQAGTAHHMAIYHTHSDEAFVPTSGTASKPGNGDVYKVGSSMTDSLSAGGISVTHSFAKHDPHDINAYHRSRRTVTQLLKEQPDAIFDVHRDSAPLSAYKTTVNGIDTARVMIVVGRSNPNMKTTLKYAQAVKSRLDALHPGLMRGIFMGQGDYNQDLYPTALLFEIGTEQNSLQAVQKAGVLLTDAIISLVYSK
ncbi:MAG TPA: stage II sporulation protein P [Syntrophomonadaceae bacterium]|nr:stage II sporulation protein P [Syntrophomonadaceae bacterium]